MQNKKIYLPTFTDNIIYNYSDIIYFKADNCYCELKYLSKKEFIPITLPLKLIEKHFDNSFFFRCHRSYVINLNFVTKFNLSKGLIYLIDAEIPLSITFKKEFKKKINFITKIAFSENKDKWRGNALLIRRLRLLIYQIEIHKRVINFV